LTSWLCIFEFSKDLKVVRRFGFYREFSKLQQKNVNPWPDMRGVVFFGLFATGDPAGLGAERMACVSTRFRAPLRAA